MSQGRKRRGRGEGGVRFDEARNLWVASVSLGYHPDGRRHRPVAYGKTKREALDALDELRRQASAPPASELTVGELLDLWLESQRGRLADHTIEGRTEAAVRVRQAMGQVLIRTLTPLHVSRFHRDMARDQVAPSAAWHAARALAGCLSYAVELQVLTSNPAAAVGLPGLPEREMVVLSPAQARALLDASRGYVAGPLIAVALGTGLRQGELLGLSWDDVDLDAPSLTVRRTLARTKAKGFTLKKPKTKASRRTVSLPAFAAEALRELYASREWGPGWTVFCGPHGRHRHRGRLTSHLKKTIARANRSGAGIPDALRWHDLRHGHASLLLSAGHSIKAVSARLGHSNPAFTLRVYAALLPGDDERLARGIQDVLG